MVIVNIIRNYYLQFTVISLIEQLCSCKNKFVQSVDKWRMKNKIVFISNN